MRSKAIRLLVEDALPEELRPLLKSLDAKAMGDILAEVARTAPDKYPAISKSLSDIGRNASYWQGETLSLKDAKPVVDRQKLLGAMDAEIAAAQKQHRADPEAFKAARQEIWSRYSDDIQKVTLQASLAAGNALGMSVASGARGKPEQLKAMLSTPALYAGSEGKLIPMFVRRGFNTGLRPAEYLAGTYGSRESIVTIKTATAKGGYLGKLMAQATTPLIVTEPDCGADNGIDLPIDDASLKHRVLARPVGDYPAGTVVDRAVLSDIRKQGKSEYAIVRSPMTCQSEHGVCAKCVGANARGRLPSVGDAAGITAANAIAEPIAQGSLSSKHTAGQAQTKREFSGFDVINRFVETPETFEDRAVVSEQDGKVTKIEDAPQGGQYVYVNDEPHYVLPGFAPLVKVGDQVEAGDSLSEGLGDPGDVVRLRGLGEGRRYYADRLKQILDDSGMPAMRRNTEMLARAALDHLVVDDAEDMDDVLPDDVLSYSRFRRLYTPREDVAEEDPEVAVGKFLQKDALHYTIGTRITPSIAARLKTRGFGKVSVSAQTPKFHPEMVRLQSSTHNNPDWLASQHTSYLRRQLSDHASRGTTTNLEHNVHFAPRLAVGKDFGRHADQTGEF